MNNIVRELFACLMLGDGVIGILQMQRHLRLWRRGPKVWRDAMDILIKYPQLKVLVGLSQIAFGLWLASRQEVDE